MSSTAIEARTVAAHALKVSGLTVVFPGRAGARTVVDRVGFALGRGEILGVVGESGAGKSTVGAAITQLIDYPGQIAAGSVRLGGEELVGKSEQEMRRVRGRRVGMIFQDPSTALCPVLSIGTQLVRAVRLNRRLPARAARRRAIELIAAVGISDPESRLRQYPHQFSGGMRQRIVIAIAMAQDPELLVADEPTTALDVSIQSEILELIRGLCRDAGTAVLLITHNMAVIAEIADHVLVMRDGAVVEEGPTAAVLRSPKHPYTRSLIRAVPRTDQGLRRFAVIADGAPPPVGGLDAFAAAAPPDGGVLLEAERIGIRFQTRRALLPHHRRFHDAVADVSFEVTRGEAFGLVGESGSGKSTVARMISGIELPQGGAIRFRGRDITRLAADPALRRECLDIQMIFQDPFSSLDPRQRVGELLAEPLRVHRLAAGSAVRRIVDDVLLRVGLDPDSVDRLPHQFSGGQRQRICIARALVMRPSLLICDEPTSALDVSVQAQVLNLLKDLQEELGLAMLFISHDLAVVRQMCTRVAVMRAGRICEIGAVDEVFDRPRHEYTRHLLAAMPKFSPPVA